MWGWLYIAVGALASALTWSYAIRKSSVIFAPALASVLWSYLALVAELELANGGTTVTVVVGPLRWVWAAFALLSMVALIGAVFGTYPEPEPRHGDFDPEVTQK
jgi:hypothetical protein